MDRVLEPQLINDQNSVKVLSESFSKKEAELFIENIKKKFSDNTFLEILDFCCGTGDFAIVLANTITGKIDAIDGSESVLAVAYEKIKHAELSDRINLKNLYAPFYTDKKYDLIYSLNSLHHFHNPIDFWLTIKHHSDKKTKIFVLDLHRPTSEKIAKEIVNTYEKGESEYHQTEAYNSLLASFTVLEVLDQLRNLDLNLNVEILNTKFDGFNFIVVWGEL
jgi:ubiquinone/menaquinone biosynthesis C-methylase UbiE